jgi:prepilin-type N-terminal cleavage/methylation domain-containing protein
MKRNTQQGFTLIELMIVVAIIGILAAVALPQYQNYTTKSKWATNIMASDSLKLAIGECLQTQGGVVASCDTLTELNTVVGFGVAAGTRFGKADLGLGALSLSLSRGLILRFSNPYLEIKQVFIHNRVNDIKVKQ